MKVVGKKQHPLLGEIDNVIMEESDFDFTKKWDDLDINTKANFLSFINIGFLAKENEEDVKTRWRLYSIEKESEKLDEIIDKLDKEWFSDIENLQTKSFLQYQEKIKPYTSQLGDLDRERRMIITPIFERDIPTYGDVMSLEDFIDCVKSGGFIDYDGYGNYVKDNKMSDIEIYPSDIKHNSVRKDFDTIIWFNR